MIGTRADGSRQFCQGLSPYALSIVRPQLLSDIFRADCVVCQSLFCFVDHSCEILFHDASLQSTTVNHSWKCFNNLTLLTKKWKWLKRLGNDLLLDCQPRRNGVIVFTSHQIIRGFGVRIKHVHSDIFSGHYCAIHFYCPWRKQIRGFCPM